MKKGTLISIIIALIAITGALLGLVAYMRSRRCLECGGVEEDFIPQAGDDYESDYYDEDRPVTRTDVAGQSYVTSDLPIDDDEFDEDKYPGQAGDNTVE